MQDNLPVHDLHIPIMGEEVLQHLNISEGDTVVDCTFGRGGHTELFLKKVGSQGKVIAFDRDQAACQAAEKKFPDALREARLTVVHNSFANILQELERLQMKEKVNKIFADLGVSSPQLDVAERGFSIRNNGPLDMRMDQSQDLSAFQVVNEFTVEQLANVFFRFGEEPKSREIARRIEKKRASSPIKTTFELAEIAQSVWKTPSKKHPATRIFQALRIFVNNELDEITQLLESSWNILSENGRLSLLSFHSLEDRLIKEFMNEKAKDPLSKLPRHLPVTAVTKRFAQVLKPFPASPSEAELESNPRSRSAKLRTIEKLSMGKIQ